ncbi:PIN-like domain-containing protein [Chryseobacterium sp. JK1]|uniref:PIN-like domain-containing protein n=1 Tax=Chryseobacterium sp. JK1 TaxID=874294 RepID=UPI003D68C526
MRKIIFVDTNIFLRFYDSNNREYKKMLKTLLSLKEFIFTPYQIKYEIDRNKVEIFKNSFESYIKQATLFNNITLPEHLDNSTETLISNWNTDRKEIIKLVKDSNKKLVDLFEKKLQNIAKSEDEVSKTIAKIFNSPKDYTNAEFLSAKIRKERGNPPGKTNDPLGDEIIWEQLLTIIGGYQELYIISNDYDYLISYENKSYLNPILFEDLKVKAHKLKVFSFQTLSDAVIYLSKNSPELIKDLPTEKELKTISKVEAELIETEYPKILEKTPDSRFDELQRLEYMKRHNLIRTDEYQSRLMKLGVFNNLPK